MGVKIPYHLFSNKNIYKEQPLGSCTKDGNREMSLHRLSYFYGVGIALFLSGIFYSLATRDLGFIVQNSVAGILTSTFAILCEVLKVWD